MSTIEFQPWPKVARLNRDITITEKLDGTNAAVVIVTHPFGASVEPDPNRIAIITTDRQALDSDGFPFSEYHVYAQSRTRFVTPKQDNYGFAGWVKRNAEALVATLGEGTHYGEWWGSGIQRKYGLTGDDKRFSLFNTKRWALEDGAIGTNAYGSAVPGLGVVPVIYEGPFSQKAIDLSLEALRRVSVAAPGFHNPEGVVIFHHASREMYKVTLEGDDPTPQERATKHLQDLEVIPA